MCELNEKNIIRKVEIQLKLINELFYKMIQNENSLNKIETKQKKMKNKKRINDIAWI